MKAIEYALLGLAALMYATTYDMSRQQAPGNA